MKASSVVHKQRTLLLCTILAMMKPSFLALLAVVVLAVLFIVDFIVAVVF